MCVFCRHTEYLDVTAVEMWVEGPTRPEPSEGEEAPAAEPKAPSDGEEQEQEGPKVGHAWSHPVPELAHWFSTCAQHSPEYP